MKNNEINLESIPTDGEEFTYDAQDLSLAEDLKKTLIFDEGNKVLIKLRPIDGPHYQLNMNYQVKCQRECSRCGVDFEKTISKDHEDFLSTQIKEGEDEGFILVEKPKSWNWAEYLRQTIELDTPYQELCKPDCKPSDERVIIGDEDQSLNSPFSKLKELKTLKKH